MDQPQSLPPISNTEQGSTSNNPVNMENFQQYKPLHEATRNGDLHGVKKFLEEHREAVRARITSEGQTALQIAVIFEHLQIVRELVQSMSADDLEMVDVRGRTALHHATFNGNVEVAKCLVETNKKMLTMRNKNNWIPITHALEYGNIEMSRYLYSVTPLEVLLPVEGCDLCDGALFLRQCYYSGMLDIALDLVKQYPKLAVTLTIEGPDGITLFHSLSGLSPAILTESQLPYWQRWIYKWVHVHEEPASLIDEFSINVPETCTGENDCMMGISPAQGLLQQLVLNTLNLLGFKNIYKAKLGHKQYLELLHFVCNVISTLSEEEMVNKRLYYPILMAAKQGNPEFIVEAVKDRLSLLASADNSKRRNIFHWAVEFRQAKVFNLIYGSMQKKQFPNYTDNDGNTLLHMAGMMAPPKYLNQISGAVLQMQRELHWFKEVESIMPPLRKEYLNKDNMTPREVFTTNHKDLVKEGEKWTKGTASSSTVVAALVATITFAAAFTVPGGNDQNTGYPMFLHKKLFTLFIISDGISLSSSSTSVLMFLGLLTSRYAEDDFLKSIPTKLIIGLLTLFISIATMMIAFCAALFMMTHDKSWIAIPVTLLACAPVTLYIWLQLPLLVDIFMSTYGPSIFDKNVKPWP